MEETRARISDTLGEIEGLLMRRKDQIRDTLDVLAPVRERPLRSIGVVLGAGLLLGLLGAGRGDSDDATEDYEVDDDDDGGETAWDAAAEWEKRARRLLGIARSQEAELELLRASGRGESGEDGEDGILDRLRDVAADRLSSLVGDVVQRVMRGG